MTDALSGIQVGEDGAVTLVRVQGKGTHLNSHLLKQFLTQCLEVNKTVFHIDLASCTYMDSTFLGTLAGLGCKVKERAPGPIRLLNATDRVKGMIEDLGIDHLFEMAKDAASAPALNTLPVGEPNKGAKTQEMLAAHEKLVELSKANEAKFRDVIVILQEKVRKTGSEGTSKPD